MTTFAEVLARHNIAHSIVCGRLTYADDARSSISGKTAAALHREFKAKQAKAMAIAGEPETRTANMPNDGMLRGV